ncbi:melanoma cell adhesion molecule b isoform X3 [Anarhichas minor]
MAARNTAFLLVGLLALLHTWGVTARVEVNMEDRVEVFRGETASMTCIFTSSEAVDNIMIQWFYVMQTGEKQRIFYQDPTGTVVDEGTPFTDRISVNGTGATGAIVVTISNVQLADELQFICLINGLTGETGEGRTKLKVFVRPDFPTIEGVQTGISLNEGPSKIGTCEVKNGFPWPNITWYRNNAPLRGAPDVLKLVSSTTVESSGLFSVKSELIMKVMKEDKDDLFYCEVNYFVPGGLRMTETPPINITVYYPSTAVSVWVESPKGNIKEGDSIELQCRENGNKPSSILTISDEKGGNTVDSNVLVLDNVTRLNSGVYQCASMDMDTYEEISGNTTVFVNYLDPAVVLPKDSVVVDQGAELTATCNALSSLQTQTVWLKDGEAVSMGNSLILKDATFDSAGEYVCVVTVLEIEGMETSGTLHVEVQGPPEIMKPDDTEMEESFGTTVDLSCSVRGFPTPSVTWTTSDGKILPPASQIESWGEVHSVVSIKVTSDITAFCNASNNFGTDALTFNIAATINTTTPATTSTSTSTTTTTTTTTTATNTSATPTSATNTSATVKAETLIPPKKEGNGFLIAVIIICILLLAILGSVLYFLYKKGKICGRSGKQDLTKEKSSKDNIVVEMKSDNTEEAVLLGVNGEKQPPSHQ